MRLMRLTAIDSAPVSMMQATGSDTALLVEVNDLREYDKDGNPQKVIGTKYTVLAPKKRHREFVVKIHAAPAFTQEQIDNAGGILVKFKDFVGKYYNAPDGSCPLSASASAIEVADGK